MNDVVTYTRYWKDVKDQHKLLKGYYEFDVFQFSKFEEDLRGDKVASPALIVEAYDIDTKGQPHNLTDMVSGAVVILAKFDTRQPHNSNERKVWLKGVEDIAKQLRARMVKDSQNPRHTLKELEINSISIRKTEVISDRWQGYRLSFQFSATAESELDESVWTL